jgi:hypothetical protein
VTRVLAVCALFLTSCAMDNVQIAEQVEYCRNHGLDTRYLRDLQGRTVRVECVEKGK